MEDFSDQIERVRALAAAGQSAEALAAGEAMLAALGDAGEENTTGNRNLRLAVALNEVALLHLTASDYERAEKVLVRALRLYGESQVRPADVMGPLCTNLAKVRLAQGRFGLAKVLLEEASRAYVALGDGQRGQNLRDQMAALAQAAQAEQESEALRGQGRYPEALDRHLLLHSLREQMLPQEHLYRADSLNQLASAYRDAGRYAQAEASFLEARAVAAQAPEHELTWTIEGNLGALYSLTGRNAEAADILERVLARNQALRAADDPQLAIDLNNLAMACERLGRYAEALPLLERALGIEEATRKGDHAEVAISLDNLASVYKAVGEHSKAETHRRRALAMFEATCGAEHRDTLVCLHNLAADLGEAGLLAAAEELFQRVLAARRRSLGEDHPEVADTLLGLGGIASERGDYDAARRCFEQALGITETRFGARHANVASILVRLAGVARNQARFDDARTLLSRAASMHESLQLGEDHPDTGAMSLEAARLHEDTGRHADARALYQRAATVFRNHYGPQHPRVAEALAGVAGIHLLQGELADAEPLYEEVRAIYEKAYGAQSPSAVASTINLAKVELERNRLPAARRRLDEAIAMIEARQGGHDLLLAGALSERAHLAQLEGRYGEAEKLFRRALHTREARLGTYHPDTAMQAVALAGLYHEKGDYGAAEGIYQPAVETLQKSLGSDHPTLARTLNDYGNLLMDTGRLDEAEKQHARALAIRQAVFPAHARQCAQSANNLAEVYRLQGRHELAAPLFERAARDFEQLYGPEHPEVARVVNNIGLMRHALGEWSAARDAYARALRHEEQAFGKTHPRLPQTLVNLAAAHWALGELEAALAALTRARDVREHNSAILLSTGSERHRMAQARRISGETDAILSFHAAAMAHDPRALALAGGVVLQRKGQVLDALVDTYGRLREQVAAADRPLVDRLAELRSTLAAGIAARRDRAPGAGPAAQHFSALLAEEERLQRSLSERYARYRAETEPVSPGRVAALLPPGAVLLEFARYRRVDPASPAAAGGAAYAVYGLDASGSWWWEDLGDARIIEQAVADWRAALGDPARDDVQQLARAVDEQIMGRLRERVGEAATVLVAPDGALNLIPFAALVDHSGRHRVERHVFVYLTSGRDLLRMEVSEADAGEAVVMGMPNYGAGDGQRRFWRPLPDTLVEAQDVAATIGDARVLVWDEATEDALLALRGPRVLHVATHGYLDAAPAGETLAISPMLRSGIVLAHANEQREEHADGWLSALELSGLDLRGTRLVVLSACETGLGEVQRGEGVQGLRRALVLSHAESQVISLWQVSSAATQELMHGFYRRLVAGAGRAEALRDAQVEMLGDARRSHPYYWAAFVQSGDWRPLPARAIPERPP